MKNQLEFDRWEISELPSEAILLEFQDMDEDGWVQRKSGIAVPAGREKNDDGDFWLVAKVVGCGEDAPNFIKNAEYVLLAKHMQQLRGVKLKDGTIVHMMSDSTQVICSVKKTGEADNSNKIDTRVLGSTREQLIQEQVLNG